MDESVQSIPSLNGDHNDDDDDDDDDGGDGDDNLTARMMAQAAAGTSLKKTSQPKKEISLEIDLSISYSKLY